METSAQTPRLPLRLLLAFTPAAFERRFVAHYVATYLRCAQVSLVLGMLLVFGDFAVDYFAHPAVQANLLRIQICMPLLGVGLAYTFLPVARRHWQAVMAGFIALVAICLFWILLRIEAEGGAGIRSWVGILNFTFLEFYCFVILGVQFRHALMSGVTILAAFELAVWAGAGFTAYEAAYWSYHVVTVFTLVVGIGWWREYLLRQEFASRVSLDEARAAAERLARTKSEFLAVMSHEIRTPMNGVLGMTELLIDSALDDTQRRRAETIRDSGQALLAVLNDILDFSKIEAGRVELHPVDVDLRELADDAVHLFALQAQQKGLEIACRVAPEVPARVRADPLRLRQILLNLLGNAIKFTDTGEVVLAIEREHDAPSMPREDCGLCFSVRDTGIGIEAEAQARLFQPFSQADGSMSRRFGGTGLGLAICRQLVELMGGRIGVDSAPGRGARFRFSVDVPVVAATAVAEAALSQARVLVVAGSATQRAVLAGVLSELGAQADTVADVAAALAMLRAARAHDAPFRALLIAPAPGGNLDGHGLLCAVQADGALRDTACVLLLPMSDTQQLAAARRAGAAAILTQPVRRRELADTLLALLADAGAPRSPPPSERDVQFDFGGARVLLAEDNAVNQEIAHSMLESLGCVVTIANHGREALARWRAQAFDLVLMDCQMPELDGFAVTRAIRAAEMATRTRVPSVAITAIAM
ncbi:MAG: ATP-binding protein, partial [Gammaproteobacteria bacterium]